MLKVTELTKSYGDVTALNALSLTVQEGSVFGLLGVNGAGKTTLLSILNGLIGIDSGKIELFGLDIIKDRKEINSISSIIPQHLAFYENLSVKENINFFASLQNASKSAISNAIEINSLEGLYKQKASTLSGGQKRRLNIAIGLLNNPKIIYFDEPTVGIDPKSRNEILDSIASYKELGITVVYTSHYMNEIERICDEVAIIDKGELIKQAKLDDLLSNRSSDKILIETIFNTKLSSLGLKLLDAATIESSQKELTQLLTLLENNQIFIKQIRYGSSNLEKYFLEVTA
ncbi:ABC transporter ATP-binding protein [Sulfurimonas sp. SAG-AH-194-C21]|nr:ABC transporter ATP-binding protein [Sulfurimonas sp. SAG-AH-194-C21]MDF1883127.1 ABC transporter ATP-binding protein [Sulfurimonas sp. SAG-AH-194-C21]